MLKYSPKKKPKRKNFGGYSNMFEKMINFFKGLQNKDKQETKSKDAAKERLHLVLMQDRANVSADFLELMKQEIIEVIKKYIEIDEKAIDVRLTNKANDDGTTGAPALYANIPKMNIKHEMNKKPDEENKEAETKPEEAKEQDEKKEEKQEEKKEEVDSGVAHPEENNKEEKKEENKEEKEEPDGEQKEERETAEISKN